MGHKRAPISEGNKKGIQEVNNASDPLKQKLIMLNESTLKALKLKAFQTGKSESELIRMSLYNDMGI